MERSEIIEIPFGAKDSELKGWEYTIPEGMEAEIKDGKIIVREKEIEDERIRKELIGFLDDVWHLGKDANFNKQCIQYPSVKDGIEAHAETYSFNIESELFNQLTKEQQALWRKEIEQACISGGYAGYELAKDPRYKENLEMKEVDLIIHTIIAECCNWLAVHTELNHEQIEDCRNLMLTVKDEQLKARQG